ncbi:MAG: sensor histidine kinase, partial [Rhodoferax sp.]
MNVLMGAAWGALYWTSIPQSTFFEAFLINAAIFLAVTNTVTMLSPYLPAFVAFAATISGVIFLRRVGVIGISSDGLPPAAPLLMAMVLTVHARNLAKGVRRTIAIRFENLHLMARVREEARKASEAHEVANAANFAKTQFLAAASHDLRQPMHALGLFMEVLARGELSVAQRQVLGNARAVADASSAMLNTLLDYSLLEAGAVQPNVRAFHLQPVLHKIESELAAQANAKGLVYRSRETHVAIMSDPTLVEMMLRNLVANAIRYTKQGGVLVASRVRGDLLWLEVWDTGIGIAAEQQAEIFREFHQLDNPERDREHGLGLGLAIVDGMARTLGHALQLESRPGRGSVFRLALPIARAAVVVDQPGVEPALVQHLNLHVLVIDDDAAVRSGM